MDALIDPGFDPGSESLRPRIVKLEVLQAAFLAEEIVAAARAEASGIEQEAAAAAEELRDRARAEGMKEGLGEVAGVLAEIRRIEEICLDRQEANIIRLSLKISRRIIGEVLDSQPDAFASMAAEALKRVRRESRICLRVHPNRLAELRRAMDQGRLRVEPHQDFSLADDPALPPDGCAVETELGVYRADPALQMRSLESRRQLEEKESREVENDG